MYPLLVPALHFWCSHPTHSRHWSYALPQISELSVDRTGKSKVVITVQGYVKLSVASTHH